MQRITFTAGAGKDRNGQLIPAAKVRETIPAIRKQLALTFGGFTEAQTFGGWVDDAGELVTEPGFRWIVLTDDDGMAGAIAQWIGRLLNQHSVIVEYEADVQAAFVENQTVEERFAVATVTAGTVLH